ncbi:MAG: DUF3857 and transglutaminase domain-containing protein [Ferruginibacter sp.]|nr:DUF3857 and transglutaminase domain-containing protein [Ferruginibacter sp.]
MLLLISVSNKNIAQNIFATNKYDVRLIAPELTKNANIVKRDEDIFVEIKSIGKAYIYTKYAITILNAAGDYASLFYKSYDKLRNVSNIEATLYDDYGEKIKSLKKNDVQDVAGNTGFAEVGDDRVKLHNFNCKTYPYTIEYECTTELKGIFYLPAWLPIENEKYAVEKSKLTVLCPADYKLRYKSFNINKEPIIATVKDGLQYQWSIEKLTAIDYEQYMPDWYETTPLVFLAPTNFEIQNYTGTMVDWKSYGKFCYLLNQGRDILPENIKQKVHELTDNVTTTAAKIKILYEYLQQNTHYISIQLGIGGWQTFDANYVATKGYGDCKALSNYMYSLLKEVGIKSFYTIIKAGVNEQPIIPDFASTQFNHIIVCVPQPKDTIWLECTSQTLPMGYLSSFTSNRNALLIDENGGILVHTPTYKKTDNLQIRKINATVNDDGKLNAIINTKYKAEQQDKLHGIVNGISKEKIKEELNEQFSLPSYEINTFNYVSENTSLPIITEKIELTANNFCSITGKRLFINPNILNKSTYVLSEETKRKFDIKIKQEYIDIDSVEIIIPKGYKIESAPNDVEINSKFGTYNCKYTILENKIIYIRKLEKNSGTFALNEAANLSNFFAKIYKADRAKMVFVKE